MKIRSRPNFIETAILGGLAIGILDMLDAFTFFGWYLGIGAERTFQGVAAGLLGSEAAAAGGWISFALGLFLHYCVALIIATIYCLIGRAWSFVIDHPVVSGLIYGVICHFTMQYVVIPLSAIGKFPNLTLRVTLNGVIGHALLVGLPVALIAAWSAKRHRAAAVDN